MNSFRFLFVMTRGLIIAVVPRIRRVLNIFDPIIFPTAISALPWAADMKLTTISGADVPMPTIVRPMTNSLIPVLRAMADDPSTR